MDLLLGGDLRYHIARKRKFTEEETKFFISCLVQALEVVHGCGIIHRDIKPENLVFESDGYLRLTDFGIARYWSPDNAQETSGTPGYMAPEVMCR
jgi:serine/threonine protein kinase